jgi:hypothetical protein
MNNDEASRILVQELHIYRMKDYEELSTLVGSTFHAERKAPGGTEYQIEIEVLWDDPGRPTPMSESLPRSTTEGSLLRSPPSQPTSSRHPPVLSSVNEKPNVVSPPPNNSMEPTRPAVANRSKMVMKRWPGGSPTGCFAISRPLGGLSHSPPALEGALR